MSSTTNKGYALPTVGADFNSWGAKLNGDLGIIDDNLGGLAAVNVAGNSNITASASAAKCLVQRLSGLLTGNISYLMPALGSLYIIDNQTTGAFTVTVKTVAGGSTGVLVARDAQTTVWSDGTDILSALSVSQIFSGDITISGDLTVGGDTTLLGNLNVSGDGAFGDDLTVGGDFGVSGSAFVTGNETVTGLLTAGSYPGTAASAGRIVLGGVTVQWGNATSSSGGPQGVFFSAAFSGTPWSIQLTVKDAPGSGAQVAAQVTTTYVTTGFEMLAVNTLTGARMAVNFFWVAIGPT